jgi:hypothetical protein
MTPGCWLLAAGRWQLARCCGLPVAGSLSQVHDQFVADHLHLFDRLQSELRPVAEFQLRTARSRKPLSSREQPGAGGK